MTVNSRRIWWLSNYLGYGKQKICRILQQQVLVCGCFDWLNGGRIKSFTVHKLWECVQGRCWVFNFTPVSISTAAATSTDYKNMCFSMPQLSAPCFQDYTTMLCYLHRLFSIKNKWRVWNKRDEEVVAYWRYYPIFAWTDYIKPITDQYYCKCTFIFYTPVSVQIQY